MLSPAASARVRLVLLLALGSGSATAQNLPPEVDAALLRAKVPREAVTLLVQDAEGKSAARLSFRAGVPMNPASVMKLVTTYAALELLGPAFTWTTPVYVEGAVRDGTLYGNLVIRGQGDPKLVLERVWLLLRRVQGLGVKNISGDIVLDHSAFARAEVDPGSFDGEPLRPYNVAPDALLLNYKSVVMTFVPDKTTGTAQVQYDPPLAGVSMQASVPLSAGDCADYRATLKAEFADPGQIRFAGSYPATCLERVWPVAYTDPRSFSTRAIEGMWLEMGGKLGGSVRDASAPVLPATLAAPVFELVSPALSEVIRDINKYSNNVMAQQVFLTLSLQSRLLANAAGALRPTGAERGTPEGAREVIRRWWSERLAGSEPPVLDNGSGLSRSERISAQALGRMLQTAYLSPVMPELLASLPVVGVDGTMRRNRSRAIGSAHLKTGSLRDVAAVAGFVHASSGKRYVLVAIINHANAAAARGAFDALLDWTVKDN
ncbi:MAG: D-alanyl-D-alanine carboxypeptidase/D-alanyl-D-alanine-endopeptidase [Burkholderiaceae bacterium]